MFFLIFTQCFVFLFFSWSYCLHGLLAQCWIRAMKRTVTGLMYTVVYVVYETILGIPFTLRCLNYFCHVPDFNSLLFSYCELIFLGDISAGFFGLGLCPGHNLGITQECVWDSFLHTGAFWSEEDWEELSATWYLLIYLPYLLNFYETSK